MATKTLSEEDLFKKIEALLEESARGGGWTPNTSTTRVRADLKSRGIRCNLCEFFKAIIIFIQDGRIKLTSLGPDKRADGSLDNNSLNVDFTYSSFPKKGKT